MIPNSKTREVESSGVTQSSSFGISLKDSAHIMTILRDTLYSDKVLAVLREYGSNAWDAHREAKKHDVPIKVTIPTSSDPTLSIRDYGLGLSHEAVFEVYTQYGSSTKRNSDDSVGMLGIGSKSGFAYSDSFTVSSWHGGTKRTYVAVLDASEKGMINLLHEEPCGDETGVEIQIPIRPNDVYEFTHKAMNLFQHFSPRPTINVTLPAQVPPAATLTHGIIAEEGHSNGWIAVMGCVPYRINIDQLRGVGLSPDAIVGDYVNYISGRLYFNIGEVQVSASREELKYSTATKLALVKKFNLLIEEFVQHTVNSIKLGTLSKWEQRLRAQVLNRLHLPIPIDCKDLILRNVNIIPPPTKFTLTHYKSPITSISVYEHSCFVIRDERKRSLKSYNFGSYDYLVTPNEDVSVEDAQKELEEIIEKLLLTGIKVKKLSDIAWTPSVKKVKDLTKNKKYQVRTFKLKPTAMFTCPWSEAWEVQDREPETDDVYVIIDGFRTKGLGYDIYETYRHDEALATAFGETMPAIYGYKTSEKKPVLEKDCVGKSYLTWNKDFAKTLVKTPATKKMLDHYQWSRLENSYNWHYIRYDKKLYNKIAEALGEDNLICSFLKQRGEGIEFVKKLSSTMQESIKTLDNRIRPNSEKTDGDLMLENIYKAYPLISLSKIDVFNDADHVDMWIEYVKIVNHFNESSK